MSIKAVRILFVVISVILLGVFLDSLPSTKNSEQVRFDEWSDSLQKDPESIKSTIAELHLPVPGQAPLTYKIAGNKDAISQQQLRRIVDLIKTGSLFSEESYEKDAADIIVQQGLTSFNIPLDSIKAKTVPAAGLLLKLFVEYAGQPVLVDTPTTP